MSKKIQNLFKILNIEMIKQNFPSILDFYRCSDKIISTI